MPPGGSSQPPPSRSNLLRGARVGASIGLASAPRHGDAADELLSAANRAMYDAKRRGKGGFVVYAAGFEAVSLVPSADSHAGFAATAAELADSAA